MTDDLIKCLRAVYQDCEEMLDELLKEDEYTINVKIPVFEDGWLVSSKSGTAMNYPKIAYTVQHDTRWTSMPSFVAAVEATKYTAQADQIICKQNVQLANDEAVKHVSYFLAQVAREKKANPHRALERSMEKFRSHVSTDIWMNMYISPLYNVEGDVEIALSERLKIRPVTEDEHARIVNMHEPIADMDYHERRLKYVLSYSCDRRQERPLDNACREYTFATNLIRLIGGGTPEFGRIYLVHSTNLNVLDIEMAEYYQSTPTSHRSVRLTTQDRKNIVELYKDIGAKNTEIKKSEFYTNAIARFGMAHRHRQSSNKVVDFVIALESLLSDASGESTFKLAHRVSALCGDSDEARLHLWEYMKETYKFRSGVVHSSREKEFRINGKVIRMEDVANELSEITARAILRIVRLLDEYTKQESILEELDRGMYDRKKLEALQKLY